MDGRYTLVMLSTKPQLDQEAKRVALAAEALGGHRGLRAGLAAGLIGLAIWLDREAVGSRLAGEIAADPARYSL